MKVRRTDFFQNAKRLEDILSQDRSYSREEGQVTARITAALVAQWPDMTAEAAVHFAGGLVEAIQREPQFRRTGLEKDMRPTAAEMQQLFFNPRRQPPEPEMAEQHVTLISEDKVVKVSAYGTFAGILGDDAK